jgi:hypothetical protein
VKFSRVSRRCDGIADEFGAIWWTSMWAGRGPGIGVRFGPAGSGETCGRGDGGDPVLGGTRLVFFFFLGDVSSFSAQVERGPFGSLPTSLITCALSAAFLLSSCGSLRADLGQSESGNSSLLPGTYRAGARSPNWPYRRFDRHRCPCPSKLRVALQYGREGSITEGGRTDRWPQITATPSGKFLQELMIVTNGNISM